MVSQNGNVKIKVGQVVLDLRSNELMLPAYLRFLSMEAGISLPAVPIDWLGSTNSVRCVVKAGWPRFGEQRRSRPSALART